LLSGDTIPPRMPDDVRHAFPAAQVVSLGGATEASIWSIFHLTDSMHVGGQRVPYGRAMDNQNVYVLDDRMRPCRTWVGGEIYIGGVGLARGYWGDDELTRQRFVTHPTTRERLYRTGDRGCLLPNGEIEFMGRVDTQVKLAGRRIELGEIESELNAHPAVATAVVVVAEDCAAVKRLVGQVVLRDPTFTADQLRAYLRTKLPDYMIPTKLILVERLSLNSNGKVDRKSVLLEKVAVASSVGAADQPQTDTEQQIASFVAEYFPARLVAPTDDLLEIGMNSIDIIQIINRLEDALGFRPTFRDFNENPTVRGLANLYRKSRPVGCTVRKLGGSGGRTSPLLGGRAREDFKNRRPGVRADLDQAVTIRLPAAPPAAEAARGLRARRTCRNFLQESIPMAKMGMFLSCLRQVSLGDEAKRLYPSAGELFPVQAYLAIKPGRVSGLPAGTYYYHPVENSLIGTAANGLVDRMVHDPFINRPVFDAAAFSLFLVCFPDAIAPIYGEDSGRLCLLECGYMGQLLMTAAPAQGIGLCPVGDLDFTSVRGLLKLNDDYQLLHSFLGGLAGGEGPVAVASEEGEI